MENIEVPLEPHHYHPNACHVCQAYGPSVKLKRCGNCKSISYCGRDHQKTHWPQHKPLCRILQEKLRAFGTIYQVWESPQITDAWQQAKMGLLVEVQMKFNHEGRQLAPYETEMLCHPRCCEICKETDFYKLHDCNDCPDASFCINHPKDDRHDYKCVISKYAFRIDCESPTFGNLVVPMERGIAFPSNMNAAVKVFADYCNVSMLFESDHTWAGILSDRLTKPFTFWYAMKKLSRPQLRTITIHVLATSIHMTNNSYFWHYLFHYERYLKNLKIVFVDIGLSNTNVEIPLCEKCVRKRCTISIQSVRNLYSDFAASPSFTKPDFVVGYDLKIHTFCYIMTPTFNYLAQLACPFILTSVCPRTSKFNEQHLSLILGKNIRPFWEGENPFRAWRPFRDFYTGDYYYDNEYLAIYEKLS